jgi:elongation factor P
MIVKFDGELHRVMSYQHVTPGKGRGMMQTKLKNLKTGTVVDNRFRSDERVEKATLDEVEMEYMYQDGPLYYFMNTENYEQIALSEETLGDSLSYLVANSRLKVEFHDKEPVGIELPLTMELTVASTQPSIKGAAADRNTKPATLETGLVIQVPTFIQEGDVVKVDTSEGKYIGRV